MTLESTPASSSLIARVKGIILSPKTEWDVIDREPATVGGLFTKYAMILALITPICTVIGVMLMGGAFALPFVIGSAVVSYVLTLVGCWLVGMIINAMAPSFGGTQNQVQAMKVAVYSSTPGWICGVFALVPVIQILGIIGALYGLYVLYLGLPKLMNVAQEKALGYTIVVVLISIGVYIVIGMIVGMVLAMGAIGAMGAAGAAGAFS